MTNTTEINHECPYCGTLLEAATEVGGRSGRGPEAGDPTVCFSCATVLVFQKDMTVRRATVTDIRSWEPGVAFSVGMTAGAVARDLDNRGQRDRIKG